MIKKYIKILIILSSVLLLKACTLGYSFSGASLSADVKTVSISYFDNRASLVNPSLSQSFTEALKDKFTSEAGLTLVEEYGDLDFSGTISNYRLSPVAIQKDEAAMMRLTISVRVKFVNNTDPSQDFSTDFSDFEDYKVDEDFTSVEEDLNRIIIQKLMEKIFMKSAANW